MCVKTALPTLSAYSQRPHYLAPARLTRSLRPRTSRPLAPSPLACHTYLIICCLAPHICGQKNMFFHEKVGMHGALRIMHARTVRANLSLLFKAEPNLLLTNRANAQAKALIADLGARVVLAWRQNSLDRLVITPFSPLRLHLQLLRGRRVRDPSLPEYQPHAALNVRSCARAQVCNVVDCFSPSLGYPIDKATGKRTNLCFQRRAAAPVVAGNQTRRAPSPTLAHLYKERLVMRLAKEWRAPTKERTQLLAAGFVAPIANATYEVLAASAHAADEIETSVRGFQTLIVGLGFSVSDSTVRAFLAEMAGTLPKPPYHDEKIANFGEVQAALAQPTVPAHLRALLRVRPPTAAAGSQE